MNQAILPLAITMMAGPQIMAAIIFVTTPKALRTSGAFDLGVAIALGIAGYPRSQPLFFSVAHSPATSG